MKEKDRKQLYQTKIHQLGLTPDMVLSSLEIDLNTLKRYISGKRFFEEPKYLSFLALLELDRYQLGYIDPKTEKTIKTPLALLKIRKENGPFSKRIRIMFRYHLFKRDSKKAVLEGFGHNLFFDKTYQTPFLYKYFLLMMVIMIIADYMLSNVYTLSNLLIAMSVPLALLILMYEFDQSTFNLRKILSYFFFGGLMSLGLTYLIRTVIGYPEGLLGDFTTGFVEETAKLLVVLLIFKFVPVRYAFTGLLIGFAVGTGFDVFETSDYGIIELFDSNGDIYQMQFLLINRTLLALGVGHHFWTAILAGTLIALNKKVKFRFRTLLHPTFILMYLGVVSFHAMWNFNPFSYLGIPLAIFGAVLYYIISFNLYQLMITDKRTLRTLEKDISVEPVLSNLVEPNPVEYVA